MGRCLFLLLIALASCTPFVLRAQYNVRIVLREQTFIRHDSIYVTGSFSNWDSTPNPKYRLQPLSGGEKVIVLRVKGGPLQYKFHRGSWQTVEKHVYGYEVLDRTANITRDTTLTDMVACWRDEVFMDKWHALGTPLSDTARIRLLTSLAIIYSSSNAEHYNADSALYYSRQALLQLQTIRSGRTAGHAREGSYGEYIFDAQEASAVLLHSLGNYTKGLELRLDNLKIARERRDTQLLVQALEGVALSYAAMKDYQNELAYAGQLQTLADANTKTIKDYEGYITALAARLKADVFYNLQKLDSALYYARRLHTLATRAGYLPGVAFGSMRLGSIYEGKDSLAKARAYYHQALDDGARAFLVPTIVRSQAGLARVHQRLGRMDSALFYAKAAFAGLQQRAGIQGWGENPEAYVAEISPLLADLYREDRQMDSAYKYLRLSVEIKDSLYNVDKLRQFQNISFNEALRQQQQAQEEKTARQQYENRIRFMLLIGGLVAVIAVALLLYRNNRQKQKANGLLQQKNVEVEEQRTKAESALQKLQAAQVQLIQQEKMASLGELTAGIAHEIQNPLNFVTNFSETNKELIEELNEEAKKGNVQDVMILAADIKANEDKISHHGKRADSIVKNMLQHARASTGEKQPTDINKLAAEYLRLSYQGMRAKDKEFNASTETRFDEKMGTVNVVPQDIGRVLLNLFNNAFYAVQQKKAQLNGSFEPIVSVTTKKESHQVVITVRDNGMGMSPKVVEKVFQPFFTTKPTGEGTGLGLSLSYDIVTKGHGGSFYVNSREGEGSEFTVQLPAL
jgi:two-component system, NtrC family, sensor kinase